MLAGLCLPGLSPARNTGEGRGLGGLAAPYPNPTPLPPRCVPPPRDVRAVGRRGPGKEGGRVGVGSGYKLSRPEASASGSTVYTPPPDPPPPSPIILHPISGHPCQRTSGNQVQEDGGGGRVWVPTIAVGWVEPDLIPLASTPRAWDLSRRRRLRGGSNP